MKIIISCNPSGEKTERADRGCVNRLCWGYYRGEWGPLLWLATSCIQDGSGVDGWTQTADLTEGFGAGCWRRFVGSLKEVL